MAFSILIKEICTPAAPGRYLCSSRSAGARGEQGAGLLRRLLPGRGVARGEPVPEQRLQENLRPLACAFGFKVSCLEMDFHLETRMGESFFVMPAR